MKKIFTKLFLLTTLLFASNNLWAQNGITDLYTNPGEIYSGRNLATHEISLGSGKKPGILSFKAQSYGGHQLKVYAIINGAKHQINFTNSDYVAQRNYDYFRVDVASDGVSAIQIEHARVSINDLCLTDYNSTWSASGVLNDDAKTYTYEFDYQEYDAYGTPGNPYTTEITYSDQSLKDSGIFTASVTDGLDGVDENYANKARVEVNYNHIKAGTHNATLVVKNKEGQPVFYLQLNGTTNKANQSITWNMGNKALNVGDQLTLDATASSGLDVTYTSSNTSAVTVSGNTLTAVGEGSATITASQAGNSNYNAAASKSYTVTVSKKDQTITWTPPTEMTVGDTHTLSATAPGGAVSYAVTGDAVTRSGNTLTAVEAGTVTITASQSGNNYYNAAANVTHTITINKATPTVNTWPTLDAVTYGTNLGTALDLKGGSASVAGTFAITDAYTAATEPNAGAHTYNLEFRPTESNKYNNVSGGTATLTVNQATPSVTWPTFAEVTYGTTLRDALQLVGGNANVEGAFHISGEYNEEEVPVVGTYKYAVWFNPTDYTNYTSLYKDDVTLTVNKANQTITWDFADCTLLPGQTLELNATATCGAMSYLVSGAAISVNSTTLTAVAEGTASIKATHTGNENYNAIESPEYTITVSASGYTRTVTNGNYGTICLPYGSSNYSGADFYEIAYAEIKDGDATGLYLDQIKEGAALVAGKPYIFKATADELTVSYEGAMATTPVAGEAGLTGTLVDIPANDVLVGNYIIAQNMFWDASAENWLNANRAYINKATLLSVEPKSPAPGRRRVSMGDTSENDATGMENTVIAPNSLKVIENGQLIIIRDGVKYNAMGVKL